jgi:hypothetical protein
MNRHPDVGIAVVRGLDHVVLFFASGAMLRSEEAGELRTERLEQRVGRVLQRGARGGGMDDGSYPGTSEQMELLSKQHLDSRNYRHDAPFEGIES